MANSNNVFANAQPLQGNVSDWVAGQEKMDFDYRTEQREVARIEQEKKEKEQLEYEKRLSKIKDFDIATTKVRSVDEINAQLLMKAKDKKLEIYKKLKPGISNEEYASLMIQDKKLDNLADYIKMSNEAFVAEMTAFQDKVAKGEIQPTEKQLKMLHSLSEGYSSFELDDDMMPMIGLWDKDGVDGKGDGKPDILSYDKIISGQMLGELIPKVNFTTTFQGLGEKLGSTKIGTDRNFVETTEKFTPIEFAQRTAKASLYDPSGNLTPIAKSWIYENKRISDWKNVPQAVLDEMEAKATRIMLDTKDTENTTKVDNSARNTANENARNAKKEDKDKATWGVVETPPIYKSSNIPLAKGYKTIAIQGKVTIPALGFKSDKGNQVITNGQLQSYSIRTNSLGQRQVVAEIVYEDVKGTSSKEVREVDNEYRDSFATTATGKKNKVKVVTLTEKDAKIFAIQLGFKDVNAMKDAARSGKENTTTTTEEFDWSIH